MLFIAGRKLRPLATNKGHHISAEEKAVREQAEEMASDGFKSLDITPPDHLDKLAKVEYKRVAKEMKKLPIRNLDRSLLESYCTWYSIYKTVSRKISEEGVTVFSEDKGYSIPNPLILTLEKASANIRSSASQLGLTVDSRMKMFVPKQEKKEETLFDKFGGR